MIAIADTETTGFPKPGDLVQPGQARVLQLAVLLCDDNGKHMTEFSTLIRLDKDTQVHPSAEAVHGISWEMCRKYGMDAAMALRVFYTIVSNARVLVFHNKKFDMQMINIESCYTNLVAMLPEIFCTMEATTDLCELPGRYGNYKWPKLSEALPILCGKELGSDAHDAMVDAKGAKDIYFELVKRGLVDAISSTV